MASWDTGINKSSQATASVVDSFTSARATNRTSSATNGNIFGFNGNNYSVVGINAGKVNQMRDAIRTYVKDIQAHLDGIDATTNSSNAFRGDEIKAAVTSYIEKVKEYSKNLTSYLLTFSDKLKDVADQWQAYNESMANNVQNARSSFGDNGAYTEQK